MTFSEQLIIDTKPDPADVQVLVDSIIEFNCTVTGYHDGEFIAIFIRGEKGDIQAGLSGFTWGGVCKIEWLWVSEKLRNLGIGRALMARSEKEALRRGCSKMVVDTHSFQAPGFYQKLGFTIAGVLNDFPIGHQQVFLQKDLLI